MNYEKNATSTYNEKRRLPSYCSCCGKYLGSMVPLKRTSYCDVCQNRLNRYADNREPVQRRTKGTHYITLRKLKKYRPIPTITWKYELYLLIEKFGTYNISKFFGVTQNTIQRWAFDPIVIPNESNFDLLNKLIDNPDIFYKGV